MKTLFISRNLKEDPGFRDLANKAGFQIIDQSLIHIKPLDLSNVPETDWIFFYSPNGIRIFFSQIPYSREKKYGVMGSGSADIFERVTGSAADFTGNGPRNSIAEEFAGILGDHSLLIARARRSVNFLKDHLLGNTRVEEIEVYENSIRDELDVPRADYVVLTSPMNAEAYFSIHEYRGEPVFAIGKTTAGKVKEITGVMPEYCENPGMEALYDMVKAYLVD